MEKTIIGSGIYFLDIISVRDYPEGPSKRGGFIEKEVLREVGGTCGNVMTMLSWMGWKAYPEVSLDDSEEGMKIREDLERYGCDPRFVSNTPSGGTSIIWCTHGLTPSGEKRMYCRVGSPGGSRFPKRHFLRRKDEVPKFLSELDFVPGVYFFDSPAAGHRLIAKELGSKGALVYFEPSALEGTPGRESVEVSDIVKFSSQNIPDVSFTDAYPGKLFIQTMGSEGLRFRYGGGEWITLHPVHCGKVVDTEGAGDWTSSAFLSALASAVESKEALFSMDRAEAEGIVRRALENAQKTASRSVGFLSSKGMIHALEGKDVAF